MAVNGIQVPRAARSRVPRPAAPCRDAGQRVGAFSLTRERSTAFNRSEQRSIAAGQSAISSYRARSGGVAATYGWEQIGSRR